MELRDRIEAHALQNAIRYGTALTGKVIPKILGEFPDQKTRMKELKPEIDAIVEQVNALSKDALLPRLEELAPDLLEKKEPKKKDLPELEGAVQGKVVTRLPPEPSKYNHLGHALTFFINSMYAERYNGKLILRFEDANPGKVSQEFVDSMQEDIQEYLGITPDEIRYVSDDMPVLLDYARTLVTHNAAYMCSCDQESMREHRRKGTPCSCRDRASEENLREWDAFAKGMYLDGEFTLRWRGQMDHKNTVLRDPVLFRAVNQDHFRTGTKYKIWPLYDFYSPIEEYLCGVTHVIRSNEFDLRVELHNAIQDVLELPQPHVVHYGRFNIKDATTKGREIREGIESGMYIGWDDPRLVTLKALRRRGIQAAAFKKLARQLGLSPYQVNLDFSMLAALNRELIDPVANRYSFIQDPVQITVEGVKPHAVTLHLHPDKKDGGRVLRSEGMYVVSRDDAAQLPQKRTRLMGDITFEENEGTFVFSTETLAESKHDQIVNWLPQEGNVAVEVMMPDASVRKGYGESTLASLQQGTIIQFERFGFCRLDRIENNTYYFWYTHD